MGQLGLHRVALKYGMWDLRPGIERTLSAKRFLLPGCVLNKACMNSSF